MEVCSLWAAVPGLRSLVGGNGEESKHLYRVLSHERLAPLQGPAGYSYDLIPHVLPLLPTNPMRVLYPSLRPIIYRPLIPVPRISLLPPQFREMSDNKSLRLHDTTIKYPSHLEASALESFAPLKTWLKTLTSSLATQHVYKLHGVTVKSATVFKSNKIGFLHAEADIKDDSGVSLPGSVFLRGASVAILLLLKNGDDVWCVLTVQPRIPVGQMEVTELPAGMVDDEGKFSGAAAKELEEECGIVVKDEEMRELTKERGGVWLSPGGSDEELRVFVCEREVKDEELKEWRGKLTGNRGEGERIVLKLCKVGEVWRETRDAKVFVALGLWEGMRREGKL